MNRTCLVFLVIILPLRAFSSLFNEEENGFNSTENHRATIRHIEGGGIGYKKGYTTLEMFFSPNDLECKLSPFLDIRGHVFDNGKWAANAGVGLRALYGDLIYGINTYYDYRNLSHFSANQIGAGIETFYKQFEFRLNGYLPVGKKISTAYDPTFGGFSGNSLLVSEKYQSAMSGGNAEVGYHFEKFKLFDLYAAVGPYYFSGKIAKSAFGGKARLSATLNNILSIEISDSYDRTFHNKFQGQLSLSIPFGPHSKGKKERCCWTTGNTLNEKRLQPVNRQEIIVIDSVRKNSIAIDPLTRAPYFVVFADNTSNSEGTYESPYHSLAQVEENSSPNDIIYLFPGDGTTTGMDSGITLKNNQKFWGSGVNQSILTSQGQISIPAQTTSSPTITNTNIHTEGNVINLATNNSISGLTITSALNDGIYGTDVQNLEVSSCVFQNINTYAIEATSLENSSTSIKNNQFVDNVNGIALVFNETSSVDCSNNTFLNQISVSSAPLEIITIGNTLTANIQNNLFQNNTTGSVRFNLNNATDVNIGLTNNSMINNGTGSQSTLASNFTVISNGTTENCSINVSNNSFSENTSNAFYMHTSGAFNTLEVIALENIMTGNGGSGLVLATPFDKLTFIATDNTITECNDNAIAIISSGSTSTGNITIKNNIITGIGNASNGIVINKDFSTLNLSITNNQINNCEGTGIISYAPTGIQSLTLNISDNVISHCQNLSSNAASGIDIEQYTSSTGIIANNTLSGNTGLDVVVGSTLSAPDICLTLNGNNSENGYLLTNPGDGIFYLSPLNADSVNVGTINTSGVITPVEFCSSH